MANQDVSDIRRIGDSLFLRIPAKVFSDSQFPFKEGEVLLVKIARKGLRVRKK